MKQPESEVFADATNAAGALLKCQCFGGAISAFYEKNAIFSAWLMRRIGASGSLAAVTGFRSMPLAMRLEPSDISTAGAGAGGTGAGAAAGGGGG
jgi:hypothetical protein